VKKWVMANWKMNGDMAMTRHYIQTLKQAKINPDIDLVIFPPAVYLAEFNQMVNQEHFHLGIQNVYSQDKGAFTGELSVAMAKDLGCYYVLIGHSERRHVLKEDESLIAKKFHLVKDYGMIPVVCIGETLEEYQNKATRAVLERQLESLKINDAFSLEKSIIAYEPVWAIGTGLTPTPKEIQEVFKDIREIVAKIDKQSHNVPLLYGGSVTLDNIKAINNIKEGQGVLIGGASLKVEQLLEITQCIVCC
jgi:triosephosphate isomerase